MLLVRVERRVIVRTHGTGAAEEKDSDGPRTQQKKIIVLSGAGAGHGWGTGTLTDADLRALVSQMTLGEEVGMVHGEGDPPNSTAANADCATAAVGCVGEAGWIPGVARLGIPPLRMTDGPAGIRLRHVETAMPAPVGLAATFDPGTAYSYGRAVGLAGRATNQDVWLGPMINEVNYPTGGRNFETLGEDPFLASQTSASTRSKTASSCTALTLCGFRSSATSSTSAVAQSASTSKRGSRPRPEGRGASPSVANRCKQRKKSSTNFSAELIHLDEQPETELFHLLVDTCVWLDLAKDHQQESLLSVLEELIKQG